jgi:hypothetical protein
LATLHIFYPGSYEEDSYIGSDHVIHISKNQNNIKFQVMNDKVYEHKNVMNYLWDCNEISFRNCTVTVHARIFHGKFQHISVYIVPFKNKKPDYDMDYVHLINSADVNPKTIFNESFKNVLGKDNEIFFTKYYNEGKIGYLPVYNRQGVKMLNDDKSQKVVLIRKLKNEFVFPKLIKTDWLAFESISKKNLDPNEYIYVKEDFINSCLKSLSGDDFSKCFDGLVAKIMTKINTSNPDIIMVLAMNILKSYRDLKFNLAFVKNTDIYKDLEDKKYENLATKSLFRPIDYIKDTFFNKQKTEFIELTEKYLVNKKFFKTIRKRYLKKLVSKAKQFKKESSDYFHDRYFEMKAILSNEYDLKQKFKLDNKMEERKEHINKIRLNIPIIYSDNHIPEKINLDMYKPEDIQKMKTFLQKNLIDDNFVLRNYLSKWGIIDHPVFNKPPKDYDIIYKPTDNWAFTKEDMQFRISQLAEFCHNDFDGDNNDCLFYAIAGAIHRPNENVQKLGKQIKKECLKACLNAGIWRDFVDSDKKSLKNVKELMEYYGFRIVVVDEDIWVKEKRLDPVDKLMTDVDYLNEGADTIILTKQGEHLNYLRRKYPQNALEYGSLKDERILERKCIDKQLYKDFIVNLASNKDDVFICPIFPEINASTSYEEFCDKVPCYCEGNMTLGHTFKDLERDESVIYYTQCPRIQIIGSLRQMTPQNHFSEKLEKELIEFCDKLMEDRDIDGLIAKHFKNIDYSTWLSRCKPNYRKAIITYLKNTEDWYTIVEPNIVNGVIKEEVQTIGDKSRMIGSPTILHKILMGPLESNFENLFHDLFPDFWGVGESPSTKEFELNELVKKYACDKSVTLDISGLDQSHNQCVKLFWKKLCDKIYDYLMAEQNSLFNPKSIKKCLMKQKTIIICNDKRDKKKHICITGLVNKMASGQGYTTVLNTSLMCFLMEFLRYKFDLTLAGKISGDDVALITDNDERTLSNSLGYVFSKKGANNKGGCGLILKYFRYGPIECISPCSLMAFECPNHGLRLIRQPNRYLSNFFYSQKMLNLPKYLRPTFFATMCIGEQYWAKGYEFFSEINEQEMPSKDRVNQLLNFLAGNTFYAKDSQNIKVKKVFETATEIFGKRGYQIQGQFLTSAQYTLLKQLNYIRNESKREGHKTPVYECCNRALNQHLDDISPIIRMKIEINECSKIIDDYYESLNETVNYQYEVIDDYVLLDYAECQRLRKEEGVIVFSSKYFDEGWFYFLYEHYYEVFYSYFKKVISKFRKFLH